uniref:Uncharacterized protein n=1 Tax=Rhizophora mucronata TaxID=61149 RepID=A0A2P2R237_RHIMU
MAGNFKGCGELSPVN